jgi:hypothetical protein
MKFAVLVLATGAVALAQQTEIQDGLFVRVTSDSSAIVRGPGAFYDAVIESVKQWRFVPGATERQVNIEFRIPAQNLAVVEKGAGAVGSSCRGGESGLALSTNCSNPMSISYQEQTTRA